MILGRVVGNLYATVKHPGYRGRKLMLVNPLDPRDAGGEPSASGTVLAVDAVGAGVGETVIVSIEGRGARELCGDPNMPVRAVIVAVVDRVDLT